MKYCLLTTDVETTSIRFNQLRDETGFNVVKEGMPLLLKLYEKYNVKSTFFFTGYIAKKFPEVVRIVLPFGHEIGCHGLSHQLKDSFDVLKYDDQVKHAKRAKQILEDISGHEVVSFRAPAGRINKFTPMALKESGFKIDSSVSSQRFDFFLSFGARGKFNWLTAPRLPYIAKENNLWRSGNGSIFEIPVSALIIPYIGTTLRIFPHLTKIIGRMLDFESSINKKPIVFLTHPNEFINEEIDKIKTSRRAKNFLSFLFRDIIRHRLKLKNLGNKGLQIYQKEIEYFSKRGYEFLTCKEYFNRVQTYREV
jgi:peptidoglycan/xylan/chitin deacetylase (PgdA/CDA1 family)